MANQTRRKLPAGVYYSARDGGMWVRWNGTPEGSLRYTHSREVAYDPEMETDGDGRGWCLTPYQGADGSCRLREVVRLAVEYAIP